MIITRACFLVILLLLSLGNLLAQNIHCRLKIKLLDKSGLQKIYISRGEVMYHYDDIGVDSTTIDLYLDNPTRVMLIVNNRIDKSFQFYLEDGDVDLDINVPKISVSLRGGDLNREYGEMMYVQDSLINLYHLPKMLNPYEKSFDSIKELAVKYMPMIDSLSQIHIQRFFDTHPASFLTLEDIHIYLSFIFEDPSYDPSSGEKERLKQRFDKLDPSLSRYPMYQECLELFAREPVKQPFDPPVPLWKGN